MWAQRKVRGRVSSGLRHDLPVILAGGVVDTIKRTVLPLAAALILSKYNLKKRTRDRTHQHEVTLP
jgi:hypothetical protein